MSKASSIVACVMQQSRHIVPQSRTEYGERPKTTWVPMVRQTRVYYIMLVISL